MPSHLGQAFHKVFGHDQAASQPSSQQSVSSSSGQGGGGEQKKTVGYFPSWAIYDRKYFPKDIPAQSLTHLLYCFANVRPETGEVYLTDLWAEEQIRHEGEPWEDGGQKNLYGSLKAIYGLKKRHRQMKVLLSIGGWSYSSNFAPMAGDANKRATFAQSAADLVKDYGLDGLDIDWEYPKNGREASDYVSLLRATRQALDSLASQMGSSPGFLLTIAAPAGEQARTLRLNEMDPYLSFWNIMTYDMAGSWSNSAGHQAPLYGPAPSVDAAMNLYLSAGIDPSKLVMGVPLYGRSFAKTDGPGRPFQGVGPGSWEEGTLDYKALPLPGSQEIHDPQAGATSCYDRSQRLFVTYDNVESAGLKTQYINQRGLGGAMWWELSGDHSYASGKSIVAATAYHLGDLDGTQNCIEYPLSKWDNLREGRI